MAAFPPHSRIGASEILHLIGVGGMGEVYRCLDTKLKREVALKVLPSEFSRDPERLFRNSPPRLASRQSLASSRDQERPAAP